jgi:ubiquitin-protein ligase
MSNFRLRRLQSDYEAVKRLVHLHPKIAVEGVSGNPPDRYRLVIRVRSLKEQGERIDLAREHRLEIVLPSTYPRDAPVCRMLTPVFHPNIAPHTVCIGDHWSAAERLDEMIQRVGEMLAFQSYNVKSPLNGQAARWVEQHLHRLPIDKEEFFIDLSNAEQRNVKSADQCSNCGAQGKPLSLCMSGHGLCGDCVAHCKVCGSVLCLTCGTTSCEVCARAALAGTQTPAVARSEAAVVVTAPAAAESTPSATEATGPAASVARPVTTLPGWVCSNCGTRDTRAVQCRVKHILCSNCVVRCQSCGRGLCVMCGQYPCQACA